MAVPKKRVTRSKKKIKLYYGRKTKIYRNTVTIDKNSGLFDLLNLTKNNSDK